MKAALTLCLLAGTLGCQRASEPPSHELDQAIIDAQRETRRQEIRLIAARDGDAAADLYRRCTEYPSPANPANQARCKTLIDRIAREDAATAATDAKRKAGW